MHDTTLTPNTSAESQTPEPTTRHNLQTAKPSTRHEPAEPEATTGDRRRGWWANRWSRCTGPQRDRGMSTAEYAVGTIAACAFAALLFKVVTSPEVQEMLSSLIDQALNTNG
ncbi:DUF4244 domain-containing protein [Nonomuraea sp. SBT364]|uniref:DUF4244 domain-containing protein n=1 Tax=Nonomuraea sp. SBT364 TaxID=1580530 RepID=UPI00066C29B7|nr:DUF4244 domain-containing protein [Nonomuraea sp. SBT364]